MFQKFILAMVRARALVFCMAVVWAVAGLWIAWNTPIDALPDLSENQVLVYSPWPDHDPPDIQTQITGPLARRLQDIPGVVTVRGSSDVGFSLLTIIFEPAVKFEQARERVRTRLESSKLALPAGVHPQLAPEGIPTGQIVWYTLSGRDTDLVELRSWQERFVAPELRQLPGVAEVASVGGFEPELHIEADSAALQAAGLSLRDFQQQLQRLPTAQPQGSDPIDSSKLAEHVAQFERLPMEAAGGQARRLGEVARISLEPAPRYGVFEKDGSEMVAGIVHLRVGANPLKVTQAVLGKLQAIGDEMPDHFRLSSCYDRTRLITGAVSTVTKTLLEALVVTTLCIVVIMRHFRTSLIISLTLPLAVLGAFLGMRLLTSTGLPISVNIMSLAGIAVSIGVLVDASVVIVENVTYQLKREFGDRPVTGDTDAQIAAATATVGRPALLAVLIMIVSFIPVFALQGIDGQLIRPLAWTKTLTLVAVIALTVTVVPALCRVLIRGRIRSESDSAILRSVIRIYRPVLSSLCDRPWPLFVLLGCLFILAAAATGNSLAVRGATVLALGTLWLTIPCWRGRVGWSLAVLALALTSQQAMRPIGLALRLPLDEGMVMDMPITIPRMTIAQASDDLKARNMLLCRFPEVQMVTGKAGRAETAFDPAPVDMIESMVEFRPIERWPKRRLLRTDARRHAVSLVRKMLAAGLVEAAADEGPLIDEIVESGLKRFDAMQREVCWQLLQSFRASLGEELTVAIARKLANSPPGDDGDDERTRDIRVRALAGQVERGDQIRLAEQLDLNSVHIVARQLRRLDQATQATEDEARWLDGLKSLSAVRWREFVRLENEILYRRVGSSWVHIVVAELCARQPILDPAFERTWQQIVAARFKTPATVAEHHGGAHGGLPSVSALPIIDPHPVFDRIVKESSDACARTVWLWAHDQTSLSGPAGELDAALQMPGWANVWTRPIQNRIDMLTTGVNSEVGIRVLGTDLNDVVATSEHLANLCRDIPGAADIIADPVRDRDYVAIDLDAEQIARLGLDRQEVDMAVRATAVGIRLGADQHPESGASERRSGSLMVRWKTEPPRDAARDGLLDTQLALRSRVGVTEPKESDDSPGTGGEVRLITLGQIASVRHHDGPATIKSTNGQLSNYVRLNVRGRDATEWVREAQQVVAQTELPPGTNIEWTGQFEHAARTRARLLWILPLCVSLIVLLLLCAFRDVADAFLMLLSVPGAISGAVLAQWLLGYPFSLSVGIGYIACFGMAAATSMVMLVYLRQALADAGGLQNIASLEELKNCVIVGAVHRLRPKLLTEATMIFSLAPLLWSTGIGADVIRPMAAPVLGGILVADEVVDLLIPAMFFAVRRQRWLRRSRSNHPSPPEAPRLLPLSPKRGEASGVGECSLGQD